MAFYLAAVLVASQCVFARSIMAVGHNFTSASMRVLATASMIESMPAKAHGGFAPVCPHDPSWQYIVDYHDDRSVDDLPDSASTVAGGFANSNAFYIGNEQLANLDISAVEVCALASKDSASYDCNAACFAVTESMVLGGCNDSLPPLKQAIVAIAGACPRELNKQMLSFPDGSKDGPSFGGARADVHWACGGYGALSFKTWASIHADGWGITVDSDKGNKFEVGFYSDTCSTNYWGNADFMPLVDTLHIKVRCNGGPCPVPSYTATAVPTPTPTPSPTAVPTPTPTPSPTAAPPGQPDLGSSSGGATATGDPHLQNVRGQHFDLMQPGKHALLHIPRGAVADAILLEVSAEAQQVGAQCADMYFQELNITGAWVEIQHAGGFRFEANDGICNGKSRQLKIGTLSLKVVYGCTTESIGYLNLYVKHIGRVGLAVGGLLGEDDHEAEATPMRECGHRLLLLSLKTARALEHGHGPRAPSLSAATASLV